MKPKTSTLALAALLFSCNVLYSATTYWVGGTSTNWTNAANWSASSVPGTNDSIIISAGSTYYPVLTSNVTGSNAISNLQISGGSLSTNNFGLTILNSMAISGGTVTGTAGDITVNGNFTISNGTFNLGSGTLSISGDLIISGGTLNVNTGDVDVSGDIAMSSGILNGGGSTSSIISGNIIDINGGTFYAGNSLDAAISINIDGGALIGGTSSITPPLIALSSGSFTKTSGTFTVSNFIISGGIFTKTSTGTVIVSQDLMLLSGTFGAGNGTWVVNGDLFMSGGLLNADSSMIKVTDSIVISAGVLNAGTALIDANSAITVSGGTVNANSAMLDCPDLNLQGGTLNIGGNQLLVNDNITLNGGTLNIANTDLSVPDDFIMTSGTLDLNNFDASVANDFVYEGGTFIDPGTFYLDNFVVDHSGTFNLNFNIQIVGSGSVLFGNGILKTSASAMLTFSPGASVSGASSSSHVNGPVRKLMAASNNVSPFVFPIGNGTYYAPILISGFQNARAGDYFTAEYSHNYPPYNHASKDTTLDHISDGEFWVLDRSASSGTATTMAHVGLTYVSTGRSGTVNASNELRVAWWDGSVWRDQGGTTSGNTIAGTVTNTFAVGNFGTFTLAATTALSALPISLFDFTAVDLEKEVKISWSTGSEFNTDFFTVEKSFDGISWSAIGIVDAPENGTTISNYSLTDPLPAYGLQYYRLVQTDLHGKTEISNIVPVNHVYGTLKSNISLFPNPADNLLNISLGESISNGTILVLNSSGMKVMEIDNGTGKHFVLDMTEFTAGLYTIEIHHENGTDISKIILN